ncbi:MAG: hypothetical protein KGO96_07725 [Elusimicrobia bacterium]|nr:hypothetical protein [Elusimicrobiota bacterium]
MILGFDRGSTNQINEIPEKSPILVENSCISFNITTSKSNHTSAATLVLLEDGLNYSDNLNPGDWVLIWAFTNTIDKIRVSNKIKQGLTANDFNDGLKFIGRIRTIGRNVTKDPNVGKRVVQHNVMAQGFSELDSEIYYNYETAVDYKPEQSILWMQDFGFAVNDLLKQGSVDEDQAVEQLIKVGLGLSASNITNQGPSNALPPSPNKALMIPNSVARLLLGAFSKTKEVLSYADLLQMFIGIQSYDGQNPRNNWSSGANNGAVPENLVDLLPDLIRNNGNTYHTKNPLAGQFIPQIIFFDRVPLWSVIKSFINEPVDEIYTCIKPRLDDGRLLPTFVARQIPFTSDAFESSISFTRFSSLPRWVIPDSLVYSEEFVKDETNRVNYVQFLGQDVTEGLPPQINRPAQFVVAPPEVNTPDIQIYGLRMRFINSNVQIAPAAGIGNPQAWNDLLANAYFGLQKRYSGTLIVKGRQEPIAEGDNLEYNGNLYHIERIMHQGSVDFLSGKKVFRTTFQLSYGISLASFKNTQFIFPVVGENNSNPTAEPINKTLDLNKFSLGITTNPDFAAPTSNEEV